MELISWINQNLVWGMPTLALFLFTGGLFSVRTGFFQLRYFRHWMGRTVLSKSSNDKDSSSISPFEAMTSALAATLGTGNIAGVCTALATGGAGAVLWMWISSILGMMTGYAENVLGIYYRHKKEDKWLGGAMYYISQGLSDVPLVRKAAGPLAVAYAVLCVLAAFGMGNMAQMNTAAAALDIGFGIPTVVSGILLAATAALVISGGTQRIASFTAKLVPLMSVFYIAGCAYILISNAEMMPDVFCAVFKGAAGIDSVTGGVNGFIVKQAVSMGLRRGVFSNEAGLGTSVSAHAASDVKEPCIQGMWSIFEVFFDTIIMCTVTAMVLLCSPCNAPTLDECIRNISTQPQYFRISDSESLITEGNPMPITGSGTTVDCRTIYGSKFTVCLHEGDMTFSNLMCIKGIQATNSNGEPIFRNGIPLINSVEITPVEGVALTSYAFQQTFGSIAGKLLAVAVTLFAFSTVIGWSQFGSQAVLYIFQKSDKVQKAASTAFSVVFILAAVVGAVARLDIVWGLCDTFNGLMALPNLFTLLLLSPKVIEITNNYKRRVFSNENIPPMISAKEKHPS